MRSLVNLQGYLIFDSSSEANSDGCFNRSVIFITQDDAELGSKGFILNKPFGIAGVDLSALHIKTAQVDSDEKKPNIFLGGPVSLNKVTVAFPVQSGVNKYICCSSSKRIVEQHLLDRNNDSIFLLGSVEWSPGDLYDEIRKNYWHVVNACSDVVFSGGHESMYDRVKQSIPGVHIDSVVAPYQVHA